MVNLLFQSVSGPSALPVGPWRCVCPLCRIPALSVSGRPSLCWGPALSTSGPGTLCFGPGALCVGPGALCVRPGALCVGARRSFCVGAQRSLCRALLCRPFCVVPRRSGPGAFCQGPALSMSGPSGESASEPGGPLPRLSYSRSGFSGLWPGALCVGARRSFCVGAWSRDPALSRALALCVRRGPALLVSNGVVHQEVGQDFDVLSVDQVMGHLFGHVDARGVGRGRASCRGSKPRGGCRRRLPGDLDVEDCRRLADNSCRGRLSSWLGSSSSGGGSMVAGEFTLRKPSVVARFPANRLSQRSLAGSACLLAAVRHTWCPRSAATSCCRPGSLPLRWSTPNPSRRRITLSCLGSVAGGVGVQLAKALLLFLVEEHHAGAGPGSRGGNNVERGVPQSAGRAG